MEYVTFENDCYNLYTIKTNRFNNTHIEIVFKEKCSREYLSKSALLFDVLMENNRVFPTHKLLIRQTEDLYNASIYSTNSRVGGIILTNVIADFLDPKFMEDSTLEEIIKLMFQSIFEPNIIEDEFDEKTFEIAQNRLLNEIDSIKEDLKQMSILNSLKKLNNNNPRSFSASGDADIIKNMTPKKLYAFYKEVLENAEIDIYVIGNLDMKEINRLIKKYSRFKSIKTNKPKIYLDEINTKKVLNIEEKNKSTQTNFVQIYSLECLDDYETNIVMPIFNLLWGSGSLESKLYKKMREENALCYNVNTFYQKYDRILIVHSAIDKDNYKRALKLISDSLKEMVKGNICEYELESAKNMIINSLNLIYDSPSRLIDNYLFMNLVGFKDIETRIDEFKSVTIKDLMSISKKIKLIENYRIGG